MKSLSEFRYSSLQLLNPLAQDGSFDFVLVRVVLDLPKVFEPISLVRLVLPVNTEYHIREVSTPRARKELLDAFDLETVQLVRRQDPEVMFSCHWIRFG